MALLHAAIVHVLGQGNGWTNLLGWSDGLSAAAIHVTGSALTGYALIHLFLMALALNLGPMFRNYLAVFVTAELTVTGRIQRWRQNRMAYLKSFGWVLAMTVSGGTLGLWTRAWERRVRKRNPDQLSTLTRLHLAHTQSIALSMLGQATVHGEISLVTAGGHVFGGLAEGLTEASERYALNWGEDLLNIVGVTNVRVTRRTSITPAVHSMTSERAAAFANPLADILQSCRVDLGLQDSPREDAGKNLEKSQRALAELQTSVDRSQRDLQQAQEALARSDAEARLNRDRTDPAHALQAQWPEEAVHQAVQELRALKARELAEALAVEAASSPANSDIESLHDAIAKLADLIQGIENAAEQRDGVTLNRAISALEGRFDELDALRADLARLNPAPSTALYVAMDAFDTAIGHSTLSVFSVAKALRNADNDAVREEGRKRELANKESAADCAAHALSEDPRDMSHAVALEDRMSVSAAIGEQAPLEALAVTIHARQQALKPGPWQTALQKGAVAIGDAATVLGNLQSKNLSPEQTVAAAHALEQLLPELIEWQTARAVFSKDNPDYAVGLAALPAADDLKGPARQEFLAYKQAWENEHPQYRDLPDQKYRQAQLGLAAYEKELDHQRMVRWMTDLADRLDQLPLETMIDGVRADIAQLQNTSNLKVQAELQDTLVQDRHQVVQQMAAATQDAERRAKIMETAEKAAQEHQESARENRRAGRARDDHH